MKFDNDFEAFTEEELANQIMERNQGYLLDF